MEAIAAMLALCVLIVIGIAITMATSYGEKLNKLTRVVSSLSNLTEGRLNQIVNRIEPVQNTETRPEKPTRGTSDLD